MDEAAME
jgi:hypothetical protein